MAGKKTRAEYFSWFGREVNNFYQIAALVKAGSRPEERIFVWGDVPMLYALTHRLPVGRYTAKYHILDFGGERETLAVINKSLPIFIISYGQENKLPGLQEIITDRYWLEYKLGQVNVFKLWRR